MARSEDDKRKGRTGPKRSHEERDAIGVLAAKLYYEEGRSLEDVAERLRARGFDVRSARDVGLAIRRAIDNQLCKVRVDVFAELTPLVELSAELAKAAGIRRALVGATGTDTSTVSDDTIHERLGDLAARFLWQSSLRPGDRIGVGPGRGVGCTVHELSPLVPEQLPYAGYRIFALTGGTTSSPSTGWGDIVDADHNAENLARQLRARPDDWEHVVPVHLPIFVPADRDGVLGIVAPHLLDPPPSGPPLDLDIAVYGCGVLSPTHHLVAFPSRATESIHAELERLARDVWPQAPMAVIDVCEHYLVGPDVPEALRPVVEDIVGRLNDRVVSAAPTILARARERILVAGGRTKFTAVLATLTAIPSMRPTTLVTDEWTARRLLETLPGRA
ncbi:MAG: sugar-binding domain-containing protein [Acidimicrobiales bacterium]